MTVRELIEELEEYPMDLPVICDLKEITETSFSNQTLYLDKSSIGYSCSDVVTLE